MSARRRCLSILDQLAEIICNQIESLQYQQLHSSLLRNQIVYQQPPSKRHKSHIATKRKTKRKAPRVFYDGSGGSQSLLIDGGIRRGPRSSLAGKSKITNPNESDHFCMGPRSYYSSSIIDFDCFFVSRPSFPQTESEIEIDDVFVLIFVPHPWMSRIQRHDQ
jgi:hypothetical protein